MAIIDEIGGEDEGRMARILLSDTKLEVRIPGFEGRFIFQSNRGSPQGDSLSGPLFTVYTFKELSEMSEKT